MKAAIFSLLAALWLGACASLPQAPALGRTQLQAFAVDARFALKTTDNTGAARSASGRMNWTHRQSDDLILLANPLGMALAELESRPGAAMLRTADNKTYRDTDAERLLADLTGYPLPIARLPAWLLGRGNPESQLTQDGYGRPATLQESGWTIDYDYDTPSPDALPAHLRAQHKSGINLKLRIEQWTPLP